MKKILISTIYLFVATCVLYAQDVKFGIRGGMNLPNIMAGGKNTPVSEGYKSRTAPSWGIFTELQFNPMVSFRFGVEYSGLGGKKNGMQAMPTGRLLTEMVSGFAGLTGLPPGMEEALGGMMSTMPPYYYANADNTVKFDYVMIPLLAQFGWDIGTSPWRAYVNAGPFVSLLLSGKQVSKGTSKLYSDASGTTSLWESIPATVQGLIEASLDPQIFSTIKHTLNEEINFEEKNKGETNVTGEMKSTNFGVTGNVGIRYQHKRNYFFLEVGGNYGFITVQENDANGSNRLGAASVVVGYAFSLF